MFLQNKFLLKADFSFCWSHDEKHIKFSDTGPCEVILRVLFILPSLIQIRPTLLPSQYMVDPQQKKEK